MGYSGPPSVPPNNGQPAVPFSSEDQTYAVATWAVSLILSFFVCGIISPLVFLLLTRDKPLAWANNLQSLSLHLCALIGYTICIPLMFCFFIGLPIMIGIYLFTIIASIIGAVQANNGKVYAPPITGAIARSWFKA